MPLRTFRAIRISLGLVFMALALVLYAAHFQYEPAARLFSYDFTRWRVTQHGGADSRALLGAMLFTSFSFACLATKALGGEE